MAIKVLELYSGIGGMHLALKESMVPHEVIASIDINTLAIGVYKYNFPVTHTLNKNIEGLTAELINKLEIDTILMSPPCQPFTRNGLQKDNLDARTFSFTHLLNILSNVNFKNLLLENVKSFEHSNIHSTFIAFLSDNNFTYQEFIISPSQLGIPNTRFRYYCIAKRKPLSFTFNQTTEITRELPHLRSSSNSFSVLDILEKNVSKDYYLTDNMLQKYAKVLDICTESSQNSCCFTRAYGRYLEGSGSVFSNQNFQIIETIYKQLEKYETDSIEYLKLAKNLNLRFFTPREVARLMCFPDSYEFPTTISKKQCYNLLGNSINIKVVSELIKLLFP